MEKYKKMNSFLFYFADSWHSFLFKKASIEWKLFILQEVLPRLEYGGEIISDILQ